MSVPWFEGDLQKGFSSKRTQLCFAIESICLDSENLPAAIGLTVYRRPEIWYTVLTSFWGVAEWLDRRWGQFCYESEQLDEVWDRVQVSVDDLDEIENCFGVMFYD